MLFAVCYSFIENKDHLLDLFDNLCNLYKSIIGNVTEISCQNELIL